MEDNHKKRRLGKGLSELLGEVRMQNNASSSQVHNHSEPSLPQSEAYQNTDADILKKQSLDIKIGHDIQQKQIFNLPIEYIEPNKTQPRKVFNPEDMQNLTLSVQEFGILQPLIVTKKADDDHYFLVAGERRWRAAQLAGLKQVPVIVQDFTPLEIAQVALIENIQRSDLNPIEEAFAYQYFIEVFELTQNEIATKVGKSRSHIANMLRLLTLSTRIKEAINNGELSTGHAKLLIGLDEDIAQRLTQDVIQKDLSVKDLARKVSFYKDDVHSDNIKKPHNFASLQEAQNNKDADTKALEADLSAALGLDVSIDTIKDTKAGRVILNYKSLEQLDEICRRLCQAGDTQF